MAQADELILSDVRCFQGEQRGRVRPITLLIGENSTGKSTFLGCYSVVQQMLSRFPRDVDAPDFNNEPFSMGSFRDIVRSRRGPEGRIDEFKLGVKIHWPDNPAIPCELIVTFVEEGSQPVPKTYRYQFGPQDFLEMRASDSGGTFLSIPDLEVEIDAPVEYLFIDLEMLLVDRAFVEGFPQTQPIIRYLEKFLLVNHRVQHGPRKKKLIAALWPSSALISLAPLRAKPKRTYDPIKETASPEGDHVPMLMMRLDHLRKPEWRSLHDDLVEFGSESGLFSDIKVRHHGKQISDPFQLQVKVHSGLHANIMDVGYGVSQSLPILVDLLASDQLGSRVRASRQKTFLLQQPEVHLHPRGQAELASLFASIAQKRGCRFLIETHSDYIIDRMRILVRQGILKESDVSIIFFEPQHNSVAIHNISLDKYGNLQNAPPSYRDFFLKETDRLLGFEA